MVEGLATELEAAHGVRIRLLPGGVPPALCTPQGEENKSLSAPTVPFPLCCPLACWSKAGRCPFHGAGQKQRGFLPGPAEMAAAQDLCDTPGDRLDAFVKHSLQPQVAWKDELKDAGQRIEQFLRDQCFRDELILDQEVRVLKVVKVSTRDARGSNPSSAPMGLWDFGG